MFNTEVMYDLASDYADLNAIDDLVRIQLGV